MTPRKPTPVVESILRRLRDLGREQGEDFQRVLTRYGVERFLHRLAKSEHAQRFVLKGAALFAVWVGKPHRPTRHLDLLGYGPSGSEDLQGVFQSICALVVENDGVEFLTETLVVEPIREAQAYEGQRVTVKARLGKARISRSTSVLATPSHPGPRPSSTPRSWAWSHLVCSPTRAKRSWPKSSRQWRAG